MTEAERQQKRREKLKEEGYRDIRIPLPGKLHSRIKALATHNRRPMAEEIMLAIDAHCSKEGA